jgi:hypothetical protein
MNNEKKKEKWGKKKKQGKVGLFYIKKKEKGKKKCLVTS